MKRGRGNRAPFAAFSLVEVVIALGIVSFGILAVIGIFGGMMRSANDNVERRALIESIDALRQHLDNIGFETAYDMVLNQSELLYVTFKADAAGAPDKNGDRVVGKWFDVNDADISMADEARAGRWIRARLQVSPSNPGGTNLAGSTADYDGGMVAVLVGMDAVPTPTQALPSKPRLAATIGLTR